MSRHRIPVAAVALSLCVVPARASIIISVEQVGSNVVATVSGTVNLTDLNFLGFFLSAEEIRGAPAYIGMGSTSSSNSYVSGYQGISGPTNIDSSTTGYESSTGTGDLFAFNGGLPLGSPPVEAPTVFVPQGYVSGTQLSATDTYNSQTFVSLGLTPGTYTWTWGTGANADFFKVQIGPATAVLEPSSAILAVFEAVAFVTYGWSRHRRHE